MERYCNTLKKGLVIMIMCLALIFATDSFGELRDGNTAPSAFFPETQYKFAPVPEGVEVRHDFVVQNRGTAPLYIYKIGIG